MNASKLSIHPDQKRWNEKYRTQGLDASPCEPSEWVRRHQQLLQAQPKGPALDVAAGNGRHAFYLARLGFIVDALDISDLAIAWLKEESQKQQLTVNPHWSNLETESLLQQHYQVVVNLNYLNRCLLVQLKHTLAPGGLLLFETMTRDQIDVLGSKMSPRFTLEPNELLHAFSDLHVTAYREDIVTTSSGKKRALASIVVRKV